MKLIMKDGQRLDFDSVTLENGTLICKRTGFKGTAIAIEVGGKDFLFRQPVTYAIPESLKQQIGFASLLSEGDEDDILTITFTL